LPKDAKGVAIVRSPDTESARKKDDEDDDPFGDAAVAAAAAIVDAPATYDDDDDEFKDDNFEFPEFDTQVETPAGPTENKSKDKSRRNSVKKRQSLKHAKADSENVFPNIQVDFRAAPARKDNKKQAEEDLFGVGGGDDLFAIRPAKSKEDNKENANKKGNKQENAMSGVDIFGADNPFGVESEELGNTNGGPDDDDIDPNNPFAGL